jgi:hypothetical protein
LLKHYSIIDSVTEEFLSKKSNKKIIELSKIIDKLNILEKDINFESLKDELLVYDLFLKFNNNKYIIINLNDLYNQNKIKKIKEKK